MINKIRKYQGSWITKAILVLTALSFMSLFGVSGYIGSANKNKPIIKVGDVEVYQDKVISQLKRDVTMGKRIFGDSFNMETAVKSGFVDNAVKKNLQEAIIKMTAKDLGIVASDEAVRNIVQNQKDFKDENGQFNIQKFRRIISNVGINENEYISLIKSDLIKSQIVRPLLSNINVPEDLAKNMYKYNNEIRNGQYVEIKTDNMKVTETITKDELNQYYDQLKNNYMNPEYRDISYIALNPENFAKNVSVSDDEAKSVYEENIANYSTPEKRTVLQMIFENEASAQKAVAALKSGKDFYTVAKDFAKQDKKTTNLGTVTKDMLIEDLAPVAFSIAKNKVSSIIKSDLGYHIIKVNKITKASKISFAKAKKEIVKSIQLQNSYDEMMKKAEKLDDLIGSGNSLKDAAKELGLTIKTLKGLKQDGKLISDKKLNKDISNIPEFIETAYYYFADETSTIVEHENGVFILSVDSITPAEPKPLNKIKGIIINAWKADIKADLLNEQIGKINKDANNGKSLTQIAKKYGYQVKLTSNIKRNNEKLDKILISQIFNNNKNEVKTARSAKGYFVTETKSIKTYKNKVSKSDAAKTAENIKQSYEQDLYNIFLTELSLKYGTKINKEQINRLFQQ
jgi:peptidyl-prolyl cis-trans isomerase D